jgi:predicted GTPase
LEGARTTARTAQGEKVRRRQGRERILILGAAGRDFHDFNTVFRDDPDVEVVAFTAAQIPGIGGRRYPPELAGPHHPDGIPIVAEERLEAVCREQDVDRVVFAYSDISHVEVMHVASRALAAGADWSILGPRSTMLEAARPVIAVSAVRTGCGKSQTARWIVARLRDRGVRVVAVRHPMPYGDLARQRLQRFASRDDLADAHCTVEEREEYESYVEMGAVIYAGVDYAAILAEAEREAQVIVWDGGNNDLPFFRPDLHVVLVDALRPDQVATHHPGEAVLRSADVVVVNKVESAGAEQARRAESNVRALLPDVPIVLARSPVVLEGDLDPRGRRAIVVDDGPTLTHGGMSHGAGFVAASRAGAEIVDPRPFAAPAIRAAYAAWPHLGPVLPALGYGPEQLADLARTLEDADADLVISGTPIDLARLVSLHKPVLRARYAYAESGPETLAPRVDAIAERCAAGTP